MSKKLQSQLKRGAMIVDALKQPKYSPINMEGLIDRFAFIDEMAIEEDEDDDMEVAPKKEEKKEEVSEVNNETVEIEEPVPEMKETVVPPITEPVQSEPVDDVETLVTDETITITPILKQEDNHER
jgi:F0F1-type ATP synthase alpha subunit